MEVLKEIERRVLWLSTSMVHVANRVRPNRSAMKVGGHEASSASMVSIMTALFFAHLERDDLVAVKPHAAPVLHAINYLLGRLDRRYLAMLRAWGGVQSYPSRTKDPDPVDFSTGSVGLGATAAIFAALARHYLASQTGKQLNGRIFALVGDAELDEGAVFEALMDPRVASLAEVRLVVDVNRQSLDRVVPGIAMPRIEATFKALGWNTITLKYGPRLTDLFAREGGDCLKRRFDELGNEAYQVLLRARPEEIRDALVAGPGRALIARILSEVGDGELLALVRDLGGHDLEGLLDAFAAADAVDDRPSVIFAFTVKGWGLPIEGHPGNHSALLSTAEWRALAGRLGADPDDWQAAFPPDTPAGRVCQQVAERLERPPVPAVRRPLVPKELAPRRRSVESTQHAFGHFLVDLEREAPEIARRVVTVSPDVASSTNLGSFINRAQVWDLDEAPDPFAKDRATLLRWRRSRLGRHIELGIAETNLVGFLSELGSTWSRYGEVLFPIGTLYDPFLTRALEPWSFGLYAGGQSIIVGTPSGVSLSFEGGAHQSVITPVVGIAQPRCVAFEPAFAQDVEWLLLWAIDQLGRPEGTSSFFRLSNRPVDQSLARVPQEPVARHARREEVIAGGYVLLRAQSVPAVTLVGMGAVMTEVIAAGDCLRRLGIPCDVVCVTSPDLLFRALRAWQGFGSGPSWILERLFPARRAAPLVTVTDGHPLSLAFLAGVNAKPLCPLGVDDFGASGELADLYAHFGIDTETIVGAAFDLLDAEEGATGATGVRPDCNSPCYSPPDG